MLHTCVFNGHVFYTLLYLKGNLIHIFHNSADRIMNPRESGQCSMQYNVIRDKFVCVLTSPWRSTLTYCILIVICWILSHLAIVTHTMIVTQGADDNNNIQLWWSCTLIINSFNARKIHTILWLSLCHIKSLEIHCIV